MVPCCLSKTKAPVSPYTTLFPGWSHVGWPLTYWLCGGALFCPILGLYGSYSSIKVPFFFSARFWTLVWTFSNPWFSVGWCLAGFNTWTCLVAPCGLAMSFCRTVTISSKFAMFIQWLTRLVSCCFSGMTCVFLPSGRPPLHVSYFVFHHIFVQITTSRRSYEINELTGRSGLFETNKCVLPISAMVGWMCFCSCVLSLPRSFFLTFVVMGFSIAHIGYVAPRTVALLWSNFFSTPFLVQVTLPYYVTSCTDCPVRSSFWSILPCAFSCSSCRFVSSRALYSVSTTLPYPFSPCATLPYFSSLPCLFERSSLLCFPFSVFHSPSRRSQLPVPFTSVISLHGLIPRNLILTCVMRSWF